jgi:hypothetical protein
MEIFIRNMQFTALISSFLGPNGLSLQIALVLDSSNSFINYFICHLYNDVMFYSGTAIFFPINGASMVHWTSRTLQGNHSVFQLI